MQEQKLDNSGIKINYKSAEKEKISEVFSKEISDIFKSPEFAYVVHAAMLANTHHNDGNKFQNDEALEILEEFAKQSPDHELSENILKLSGFAKNNKERDRNISLVADLIRFIAGVIALNASINESNTDDSETTKLNSTSEIAGIVSLAIQIIASPISANSGYKASFTGHFTNEMADAFERVATLLQNKIDRQEINRSLHSCSHNHSGSLIRRLNLSSAKSHNQLETSFSKRAVPENDYEHNHNHTPHLGSQERHFGTFLNGSSVVMSLCRMLSEFNHHLTKSNPLLNNINSSILALTAPVLSIIGKFSSHRAAEIRDKEVCEKISTAKKDIGDNFAKIFNKALEASFINLSISTENAKIALQSELVAIGKKMEEETKKKRSESGIKMSTKIWLNYMKDSVYGISYETIKFFYDTVPSLWIADSSAITQAQISSPKADLELQKKDSELNLKNLDELKKQIGSNRLSECDDALTKFLSQLDEIKKQIENQSQSSCLDNSCTHSHSKKRTILFFTNRARPSTSEPIPEFFNNEPGTSPNMEFSTRSMSNTPMKKELGEGRG